MKNSDKTKIVQLIQKIKFTPEYQKYQTCYQHLMQNPDALQAIAEYKHSKSEYADVVLQNNSYQKEEMKKVLLEKKLKLNEQPIINEYFLASRKIEIFLDDLNYNVNQLVGKVKKHHCHK